jgi:hypothetical protein
MNDTRTGNATGKGGSRRRNRRELLEHFQDMAVRRVPIIGGGAGTGLSAKSEEAGGIDLIVIYNSGRYRMAGRGSLAGLLAFGLPYACPAGPAELGQSLRKALERPGPSIVHVRVAPHGTREASVAIGHGVLSAEFGADAR